MNDCDLFKPSSPEKKLYSYYMPSTGAGNSGCSGSSSLALAIISISSIFRIEVILWPDPGLSWSSSSSNSFYVLAKLIFCGVSTTEFAFWSLSTSILLFSKAFSALNLAISAFCSAILVWDLILESSFSLFFRSSTYPYKDDSDFVAERVWFETGASILFTYEASTPCFWGRTGD